MQKVRAEAIWEAAIAIQQHSIILALRICVVLQLATASLCMGAVGSRDKSMVSAFI